MPEQIRVRGERAIEHGVFPGCVIGFIRPGERRVIAMGTKDGVEAVEDDTVYDVASVTKSIPVASLTLTLFENGLLRLSDRVASHLPDLENHYDATLEDLLRYRVHGEPLSRLRHLPHTEMERHIYECGFSAPAGEAQYSNLPAYLLGRVLESASGERLDDLAHQYFFGPLHMDRTSFGSDLPRREIAPTEMDERGEVRGAPHDESAYVFKKAGQDVGHAGLFSTAPDLLSFLRMLLEGFAPHVSRGAEAGLGWQVNDHSFMGSTAGAKTFGKTGFTGCSILCDMERRAALVVLSNRTYPKRPDDALSRESAMNAFRRDIAEIVLGGI